MVAVLHHMPLEAALRHASELLEPGGRLLVVGLARADTVTDFAWDLASALLNPWSGWSSIHSRSRSLWTTRPRMPMRDPVETFAEISRTARRVLPGAQIRHRLFFRYTLEWTRPA